MKKLFCFFVWAISTSLYAQKFEGLALTPPMGWNSWNKFACNVNEQLIRETADAMVSSGLKGVGYRYIIIDDCWHGKRDSLGFIQPDPSLQIPELIGPDGVCIPGQIGVDFRKQLLVTAGLV